MIASKITNNIVEANTMMITKMAMENNFSNLAWLDI